MTNIVSTTIKSFSELESIIEVKLITENGENIIEELAIEKTEVGHAHDDFSFWSISRSQSDEIQKVIDDVIEKMEELI